MDSEFRKDMEFGLPLSGENRDAAGRIGEGNSVSIHLRRGDYVRGGYRLLEAPRCPNAKAAAVTENWGWIQI